MKKIKVETTALLKPFKYHNQIKENLLSKINNSYNDNLNVKDQYYGDQIHRLDWSKNLDYSREWIQLVKPKLEEHFYECANNLNYQSCEVRGMWYQQYTKNNTHGWHIHGENYTGVYYLEMNHGSPATEIYDGDKVIQPEVNEGELCIFPSTIIHRAPSFATDARKTIISFNTSYGLL
mgnify:CR=1 FL=1